MMLTALLDAVGGEAITSRRITQPIIIVGPPRTGTTFLHRALSRHPDMRFLPYFEALETVAPSTLAPGDIGSDTLDVP